MRENILPQVLKVTPCCGSVMRTPGTEGFRRATALLAAGICPDCEIVLASRPKPGDTQGTIRAKEWFDSHASRSPDLSWHWSDEAALVFFGESPENDGRRVGSRAGKIVRQEDEH